MADLFDVIADPTRRELLRALLEAAEHPDGPGEASVGQLVQQLSLSQPTVSKHLKTLREFSLVIVREQGQHRFYRIDTARLQPIAEWVGGFLKPAALTEERVGPAVLAVADAAPDRPLSPRSRAFAVRLGARAAAVAGSVPRPVVPIRLRRASA